MRWIWLVPGLATCAATLAGCSNLEARRVPVSKRIEHTDDHIHGFRYYLSRPYLVVAERIDVVKTEQPARVVRLSTPDGALVVNAALQALDETGHLQFYDLHGNLLGELPPETQPVELSLSAQLHYLLPAEDRSSGLGQDSTGEKLAQSLLSLAKTDGSGSTPAPQGPAKPAQDAIDSLQIVCLPDFEEQMAVEQINVTAKAQYSLSFLDGWQLKSVSGSFDSTDVPIKILQSIKNAIGAAGDVENHRLELEGNAASGATKPSGKDRGVVPIGVTVSIVKTLFIEPGMYRLRKHRDCSESPSCGAGLLADLGIPVETETKVQLKATGNPPATQKKMERPKPEDQPMPAKPAEPAKPN